MSNEPAGRATRPILWFAGIVVLTALAPREAEAQQAPARQLVATEQEAAKPDAQEAGTPPGNRADKEQVAQPRPTPTPAPTESIPEGATGAKSTLGGEAGGAQGARKKDGPLGGCVSHDQGGIHVAGFQINGRFDLAYEMGNFALDGAGEPKNAIKNYHHFLFLSRNQQDEWFSFNAEIIDRSFYEVGLKLGNSYQLRLGKVMVPFGSDPLFHHTYGGVSGIDQKLLPVIWAEHGAVFDANLLQTEKLSLDNEFYLVAGFAGNEEQVLSLSGASDPGTVAIGDRLRFGYDKFAVSGSLYWDRYAAPFNMFLWGFDFSAGYGFLPWPYLDRLAVKLGFVRADIQGSRASGLGDYYHFGDYLQLDYRLPWTMGLRYRTGIVTMENQQGLFFDDRADKKSAADTLAHSLTVWKRYRGLTLAAEFIINIESAGEVDNDLLRLTAAIDF